MFENSVISAGNQRKTAIRVDWPSALTFLFLLSLTALSWVGTLSPKMGSAMMIDLRAISVAQALSFVFAWGVMMAAMMLPSAMPMILFYGALRRKDVVTGEKGIPASLFMLTYLVVWLATGIPVYLINVGLGLLGRIYPQVATVMPYLLALSFVLSGLFQFSDLKKRCLKVCQHPFSYLMSHWYSGYKGTLRLSVEHSFYCVGCCWGLMVILATIGSMSLRWVLLLTVAVFVEKIFPRGEWYAWAMGGALMVLGVVIAIRPDLIAVIQGPMMPMEPTGSSLTTPIPLCAGTPGCPQGFSPPK